MYNIYLNIFKNKNGLWLTDEERENIIRDITEEYPKIFNNNQNKDNKLHYPVYYDDKYYFGSPIVLRLEKKEFETLLKIFRKKGLYYWIQHLYALKPFSEYRFCDVNGTRYMVQEENLVNEYENGYGVIHNKTSFEKLLK